MKFKKIILFQILAAKALVNYDFIVPKTENKKISKKSSVHSLKKVFTIIPDILRYNESINNCDDNILKFFGLVVIYFH